MKSHHHTHISSVGLFIPKTNKLPFLTTLQGSGVVAGGGGQSPLPSDNFLGAPRSKWGAKIRNCNLKYYSNSGISIAIQLSNSFWIESIVTIFRGAEA